MFRSSRFHMTTTSVLDSAVASSLLCWKATRRQQSLWNGTTYVRSTAVGDPVLKLSMAPIEAPFRRWTMSRQSHERLSFLDTSTNTSNLPATKNTPMLTTSFGHVCSHEKLPRNHSSFRYLSNRHIPEYSGWMLRPHADFGCWKSGSAIPKTRMSLGLSVLN